MASIRVSGGSRRRRRHTDEPPAVRRAGKERLVEVGSVEETRSANGVDYSNARQFDAIDNAAVLLYYVETADDVLFDPENDERLFEVHERPFAFVNATSLALYESLIERARFYCKPHPNQVLARRQAVAELALPTDDETLLIMVYKRDAGATRRDRTPFRNATNGLPTLVVLFRQFSHDPFARATLVWQRETSLAATVGLIGLRIDALYG